jgi:glutamine synthetase
LTLDYDIQERALLLEKEGVVGVTIVWADNNGIPRSRTVPIDQLPVAGQRGVGITPLFAVFSSLDGITFGHDPLSTPSGDIRLMPVTERLVRLAGQPGFAWVPGRQVAADGSPWPYDPRGALERQLRRAAERGLEFRAGYEMEFQLSDASSPVDGDEPRPPHAVPSYGPAALLAVDAFAEQLMRDMKANGIRIGQFHAEYGPGQYELSIAAADPVTAADHQLLARQTIHAAAQAHSLRASFAPLVTPGQIGNGWHLHTSVARDGVNVLSGGGAHGMSTDGAAYVAGLLRDLPAIVAVTAPSLPSLQRRRPGYWCGAYGFWGIENREAALRFVPSTPLLGADHANVELKPSDATANPYLALTALIAAGIGGIDDGLELPPPVQEDPATWPDAKRVANGIHSLPTSVEEQIDALLSNRRIRDALGEELSDAFRAVRIADATAAAGREDVDILRSYRWLY